jgi:hypothetical protein
MATEKEKEDFIAEHRQAFFDEVIEVIKSCDHGYQYHHDDMGIIQVHGFSKGSFSLQLSLDGDSIRTLQGGGGAVTEESRAPFDVQGTAPDWKLVCLSKDANGCAQAFINQFQLFMHQNS